MRASLFLPFFLIFLCACAEDKTNEPPVNNADLEWLKQKIKDDLVFVEGGTFRMGDEGYRDENGRLIYFSGSDDNKIIRNVTLTGYSMQRYEVTFKEMDIFSGFHGKDIIAPNSRHGSDLQPTYPAFEMTWQQARDFCQWAGELIEYSMDLPTESQWEYAARSRGLKVQYATDNGRFERGRNVADASLDGIYNQSAGTWPPNPLGLYDMTANVDEWMLDWYISRYPFDDEIDPAGPSDEQVKEYGLKGKVTRGGNLASEKSNLYRRIRTKPDNTGAGVGFRCVANHPEPIK